MDSPNMSTMQYEKTCSEKTTEEFKILPIKETKARYVFQDERVPSLPARICIVSGSDTGKSTMAINLVDRMYKLKNVYLVSQTYKSDGKWLGLTLKDVKLSWDEGWLYRVKEDAEQSEEHSLLIIEDMLDKIPRNSPALTSIATMGRHSNLSLIITTQYYRRIPPLVRTQFSDVIMFKINNKDELKKIIEDNAGDLSTPEFISVYARATTRPFGFLWIDKRKQQYKSAFNPNSVLA